MVFFVLGRAVDRSFAIIGAAHALCSGFTAIPVPVFTRALLAWRVDVDHWPCGRLALRPSIHACSITPNRGYRTTATL